VRAAATIRSAAASTLPDRVAGYDGVVISEGKKAPAFQLAASTGESVALSDFKGRIVVLYFYPRDNTPGCTTEAMDFQAALPALTRVGAVVLGVSRDSIASHCKFADKHGLTFPLLSDPDATVLEAYGAWGEKTMYGRSSKGILRTTVVIGANGRIAKIFPKVRVKGHVDAVVEAVEELARTSR
jgi:thioredoxin-dependent peroxiredoxin